MDSPTTPRLLDRVRDRIRVKHYSIRTEQAYVDWIRRFIRFHGKRHPAELGSAEVEAFLTHLAVAGKVAASTQNQAKSALLFLYREVLAVDLPWLSGVTPAKAPSRLPVVLSRLEVTRVLRGLRGTHHLIGCLLYGTGMRIMEGVRLRIKDVDFARREIIVRNGKGAKDRMTMLPRGVERPLRGHLVRVRELHAGDLAAGHGAVFLPDALARKYPNAARVWARQYVFPAKALSSDPRTGCVRRHHLGDQAFQRAMRQAVRDAGLDKPATPHTLRTLVRDAPARRRLRHPHGAGAAWPQRCRHDDDLHARPQSRRPCRGEPARSLIPRLRQRRDFAAPCRAWPARGRVVSSALIEARATRASHRSSSASAMVSGR